jgi:DNA-binding transcriptional regulator YiaG
MSPTATSLQASIQRRSGVIPASLRYRGRVTAPNSALRAVRISLRLSQDEFARAIRDAGHRARTPNDANKRLVQRWESGEIGNPRPMYARALEAVTGLPLSALGFAADMPDTDTDDHASHPSGGAVPSGRAAAHGSYTGIWLSRYEYFSSGREASFVGLHYAVLLQHADRLTVRSLPGSADSLMTMDLSIDGNVITGTWVEQTAPDSYYRGARYHGAIQMLVEPTGRNMAGKWVGFGKDMDVNVGPWELIFQDAATTKAAIDRYNHPPTPQ